VKTPYENMENENVFEIFNDIPEATLVVEQAKELESQKRDKEAMELELKKNKMIELANSYKRLTHEAVFDGIEELRQSNEASTSIDSRGMNSLASSYYGDDYGDDYGYEEDYLPSFFFENLFKDIQCILYDKGYYLVEDENGKIILSIGKPDGYDESSMSSNGLNKIPDLFPFMNKH